MRMTFDKQVVKVFLNYVCTCGKKFKRVRSDWFTMNPFNTKTSKECREGITAELLKTKCDCPKCGAKNLNPTND